MQVKLRVKASIVKVHMYAGFTAAGVLIKYEVYVRILNICSQRIHRKTFYLSHSFLQQRACTFRHIQYIMYECRSTSYKKNCNVRNMFNIGFAFNTWSYYNINNVFLTFRRLPVDPSQNCRRTHVDPINKNDGAFIVNRYLACGSS